MLPHLKHSAGVGGLIKCRREVVDVYQSHPITQRHAHIMLRGITQTHTHIMLRGIETSALFPTLNSVISSEHP